MRIWIDADATPREAKDVVFRASTRLSIAVVVVANKAIFVPRSPLITMVQVPGGPDVADDHIAGAAAPGDLVITHDIPLAARVVAKGIIAIDPRGQVYDAETVGERLSVRDFMTDLRDAGHMTGGPSAYAPRDKQRFASALDRALLPARRA